MDSRFALAKPETKLITMHGHEIVKAELDNHKYEIQLKHDTVIPRLYFDAHRVFSLSGIMFWICSICFGLLRLFLGLMRLYPNACAYIKQHA